MNDISRGSISDPSEDDDAILGLLLRQSSLPGIPVPPELSDSVQKRLPGALSVVTPRGRSHNTHRIARLKWIVSTAAVAMLIAAAVIFFSGRQHAWAQVAATLRGVPWIHMKSDATLDREMWLSPSLKVSASRSSALIRYDDHRLDIWHEFNAADKLLYKVPINDHDDRSFQSISSVFGSIFRGDGKVGDEFAEDRIVNQKRRSVEIDGRKWIEYELTIERSAQSAIVVVRVDPEKNLPVSMRFEDRGQSFQFSIDYPKTGPDDIYALNVAREIQIEDRMPSGDLKRIAGIMNRSRKDLDNYVAAVGTIPGSPGRVVYRKGDQWRACLSICGYDIYKPDDKGEVANKEEVAAFFADRPPLDKAGSTMWWRQRLAHCHLDPVMLCDGRRVWQANYNQSSSPKFEIVKNLRTGQGHEAAQQSNNAGPNMLEFQVFPDLNSYVQIKLTLDEHPAEGPEGTLLVTRSYPSNDPNAFQATKYWLDPKLGYAVVKYEHSDCKALEADPDAEPGRKRPTYEFKDFQKSPQGIWYPTVVVWKNAIRKDPDNDASKASPTYSDLTTYYHLDFTTELPDSLFKP